MSLREYNQVQSKIIKKYQLLANMQRFVLVCKLFSEYREQKAGYTTTKRMIKIARNNLT